MGYKVHTHRNELILGGMGLRIYYPWRIPGRVMLKFLLQGDRITFYYSILIEGLWSNRCTALWNGVDGRNRRQSGIRN
jgi:hypothetical protein